MKIPEDIDYTNIQGLSNIAKSNLNYQKPSSIAKATRISGVTYNDIAILVGYINGIFKN